VARRLARLVLALGLSACTGLSTADLLEDKACTAAGECAAGYACDATRNVCVHAVATPGSGGRAEGGSAGGGEAGPGIAGAGGAGASGAAGTAGSSGIAGAAGSSEIAGAAGSSEIAGAAGASGIAGAAGAGGATPACPIAMALIPASSSFCIDQWEVTQADYQSFLDARGADTTGQPAACAWNGSFVPTTDDAAGCSATTYRPVEAPNLPVVCVDWCDADAYCTWRGKRLCGRIGGGSTPEASGADAAVSEWYAACSSGGTLAYPYGDTYDAAICNGSEYGTSAPIPVGQATGCHAPAVPFATVFDLSGNVREWENSCTANTGATDGCRRRGGGWDSVPTSLICTYLYDAERQAAEPGIGVRCCADPVR
jgi:formylglycine-generating enzyme